MKITLCGSLGVMDTIMAIGKELKQYGHTVFFPTQDNRQENNSVQRKTYISKHMNKIKNSDAIFVANVAKNGEKNYIGAHTFMEMGYAHYLGKKIFTLNDLPDQSYIKDEIMVMNSMTVGGDFSKLV